MRPLAVTRRLELACDRTRLCCICAARVGARARAQASGSAVSPGIFWTHALFSEIIPGCTDRIVDRRATPAGARPRAAGRRRGTHKTVGRKKSTAKCPPGRRRSTRQPIGKLWPGRGLDLGVRRPRCDVTRQRLVHDEPFPPNQPRTTLDTQSHTPPGSAKTMALDHNNISRRKGCRTPRDPFPASCAIRPKPVPSSHKKQQGMRRNARNKLGIRGTHAH